MELEQFLAIAASFFINLSTNLNANSFAANSKILAFSVLRFFSLFSSLAVFHFIVVDPHRSLLSPEHM